MTAPARISQADMERAMRAARKAGWPNARFSFDLVNGIIAVTANDETAPPTAADEDDGSWG